MARFPGFPSVSLLYCSIRPKFLCFCQVTGLLCPALHALSLRGHVSGSFQLVAQFVGVTNVRILCTVDVTSL
jgi:hypothetical protein